MKPDDVSCKRIYVNLASAISNAEIEEWLGARRLSSAGAQALGLAEGDLHIGHVQLILGSPLARLTAARLPAETQWTASVTFRPLTDEWLDCAIYVALQICEQVHSERGGCFLAADDDGVLFFIGDEGLVFNERARAYFSRYPHGFDGAILFQALPAV